MLWDDDELKVNLRYAHRFFLHAEVTSAGGKRWEITAVYASPNANVWKHLWDMLDEMIIKGPWVVMGDFNCVLRGDERSSRVGASSSFASRVERRGLMDLGFIGPIFT